ncbi:MAG: hypothetical protein IMZ53_00535 [Thermoplasmata archaeon]|nr:hypothetical protein [Thermoplasmata archaeon]
MADKRYIATLIQASTAIPAATIIRNTYGGTIVYTRSSAGVYVGTLASAFDPVAKTTVEIRPLTNVTSVAITSINAFTITMSGDDTLASHEIEINTYDAVSPVQADASAIISLTEVKDYLKIPTLTLDEDNFLQLVINNQSKWIEAQIINKVVSQLITAELSLSTGRPRIRTKYFPIVSLTLLQYLNSDLVWTDMLTTLTDAVLHNPENQFSNENNSFHIEIASDMYAIGGLYYSSQYPSITPNVKVSYYAGYATIPTDIHDVCLERVVNYFKQSRRSEDRFGKDSESNSGTVAGMSTRYIDFAPRHKEMLKPFKRRYE